MTRGTGAVGPATWRGVEERAMLSIGVKDWLRLAWRLPAVLMVTGLLLPLWLILLALDRRSGRHRAFGVARAWSRLILALAGLRLSVSGRRSGRGVMVANHASWLDIPALHAGFPVYFVAKEEVAAWPLVGFIARVSGTLFVARRRSAAAGQKRDLAARIAQGHSLCFFPEGTSSDGQRILPFKATLFAALEGSGIAVQPVTISYRARRPLPPEFYATWGRMPVFAHMAEVLALSSGGVVTLVLHPPLASSDDRKEMARLAEAAVRQGFSPG